METIFLLSDLRRVSDMRQRVAFLALADSLSWRHSFACAIHDAKPCTCKDNAE